MGEGSGAMRVEAGMCTQAKGKKLVGGTQNSNLRKSITGGAGHWRGGLRRVLRGEDSWGRNRSGSQCDTTWRPISSGWKLFQLGDWQPRLGIIWSLPPTCSWQPHPSANCTEKGLKSFLLSAVQESPCSYWEFIQWRNETSQSTPLAVSLASGVYTSGDLEHRSSFLLSLSTVAHLFLRGRNGTQGPLWACAWPQSLFHYHMWVFNYPSSQAFDRRDEVINHTAWYQTPCYIFNMSLQSL